MIVQLVPWCQRVAQFPYHPEGFGWGYNGIGYGYNYLGAGGWGCGYGNGLGADSIRRSYGYVLKVNA